MKSAMDEEGYLWWEAGREVWGELQNCSLFWKKNGPCSIAIRKSVGHLRETSYTVEIEDHYPFREQVWAIREGLAWPMQLEKGGNIE